MSWYDTYYIHKWYIMHTYTLCIRIWYQYRYVIDTKNNFLDRWCHLFNFWAFPWLLIGHSFQTKRNVEPWSRFFFVWSSTNNRFSDRTVLHLWFVIRLSKANVQSIYCAQKNSLIDWTCIIEREKAAFSSEVIAAFEARSYNLGFREIIEKLSRFTFLWEALPFAQEKLNALAIMCLGRHSQ